MSQIVYVDGSCIPMGITNGSQEAGVSLYPNPASGSFTLELGLTAEEKITIEIFNPIGQNVFSEQNDYKSGNNRTTIDLTQMPRGVYLIKLKGKTTLQTRKIVLN
jgi:hypothetical protein